MYVKLIYGQHRHFTVHITKTLKKNFFQYSKAIVLHDKIPFVMLNHEQNPVYLCCYTVLSGSGLGLVSRGFNFSTWETEAEAGESLRVLVQPSIHSTLQNSQDYIERHGLNIMNNNNNNFTEGK